MQNQRPRRTERPADTAAPANKVSPVAENALSQKWLLGNEVMEMLYCSDNTLRKYRKEKLLPFSKLDGRIFYNPADVQNLLVELRKKNL